MRQGTNLGIRVGLSNSVIYGGVGMNDHGRGMASRPRTYNEGEDEKVLEKHFPCVRGCGDALNCTSRQPNEIFYRADSMPRPHPAAPASPTFSTWRGSMANPSPEIPTVLVAPSHDRAGMNDSGRGVPRPYARAGRDAKGDCRISIEEQDRARKTFPPGGARHGEPVARNTDSAGCPIVRPRWHE